MYTGNLYNNSRLYTAREWDVESKLYYYRARYYDANLGRFVSRDPIGQEDQVNLYTYVRNNPFLFTDPSGENVVGDTLERVFKGEQVAAPTENYEQIEQKVSCNNKNLQKGRKGAQVAYTISGVGDIVEASSDAYSDYNKGDYTSTLKNVGKATIAVGMIVGGLGFVKYIKNVKVGKILKDEEVLKTLERVEKNSPKVKGDAKTFRNTELKLPKNSDSDYYSEWQVDTPGLKNRGERRVIKGKGGELYYTDDHYESFTRLD